ncbi:hypothetical protein [Acidilobus sp.]|jgi:hypothetical protein|uniref:hypothetical protein n=1 Tax=Acidilobus sp. TaxID=1872109 RepID=UPI003D07087B
MGALLKKGRGESPEPPRGVIEVEGLAMNGLLKSFSVEDCGKPKGYQRIVAETIDGRTIKTGCLEPDAARREVMVMNLYLRQWSKFIVRQDSGR